MVRSLILWLFVLATLSSCGGPGTANEQSPAAENPAKIAVDTFSAFPPEIDGCACYFSNDEAEFKNNRYIYVDNFENTAFVRINGTTIRLMLVKVDTVSDVHRVKVFNGEGLELTIDITQVGQIDETWQQKGTMVLKPKKGAPVTKNIYGECGC